MRAKQTTRQNRGQHLLHHLIFWAATCLVPIVTLAVQPNTAVARDPSMSRRDREAAMLRKQLTSKHVKAYHGKEVHPSQRWYVLLLRDRTVEVTQLWPGLSRWTQKCTVRYTKVQGVEQAVSEIMSFRESTPIGHVREFDARYFVLDSQANAQMATLMRDADAVGAQPVLSESDATRPGL